MLRYALRRLGQSVFVLFAVSVLVHIAMFVLPGDPIRPQFGTKRPDPEVLRAARAEWGLDDPWPLQYGRFLGKLLTGDLGRSYTGAPVDEMLARSWQPTLKVAAFAIAVQVTCGLTLGVLAARRPGGWLDRGVMGSVTLLLGVPLMVFAVFFADTIPWLLPGVRAADNLKQVILPGLVLALLSTAITARLTRIGLRVELREAYVRVARAKGLPAGAVVRHAFRTAVVPVVAFIGADVAAMSSTLPVIEKAFYLHGLGERAVDAARANDTAPLIALVAVFTLVAVVANLVADLVAAALDPRRRGTAG